MIWKIEESYDELFEDVKLSTDSLKKLNSFSSNNRKIEFLATRKLLEEMDYTDFDLSYNSDGAPKLKDRFISISHTKKYVSICISKLRVGIDIERKRSQIFRISHKFVNDKERVKFNIESIDELSVIWNSKEAMFKLCDRSGIDFKANLNVDSIDFSRKEVIAEMLFNDMSIKVEGFLDIFDDHTLVCLMNV
ncbi:MAG: 4'-phosphopantetheinyl transferase superfamily protein [Flavobacteriales bacterium]|nr:4'-phosphopantetheinyl transferase superfamily protein [Flavobacteriales bacterium]